MRVALAKLTLANPNFLVLDEPTTHLDIASQEVLQEVLSEFDGTVLFVSHDRYLIEALATQVWAIEGRALHMHRGRYSEYIADKAKGEESENKEKPKGREGKRRGEERTEGRERERRARRMAGLEDTIAALENRLGALVSDLTAASAAQDVVRLTELGTEYA